MLSDILALAAGFPRWYNGEHPDAARVIPGWSTFYLPCRLCGEAVLNDINWQRGHWAHHIFMGDIALRKERL